MMTGTMTRRGLVLLAVLAVAVLAAWVWGAAPAAALPNVNPEAPPGSEGFLRVVSWVAWGVAIVCLVGFLVSAGFLAVSWLTGREVQGVKGIVIVLISCAIFAAGGAIVGAVIG